MSRTKVACILIIALLVLGAIAVGVYALRQSESPIQENAATQSVETSTQQANDSEQNNQEETMPTQNTQTQKALLRIGSREFAVTLADNETARAFAASLPMTIEMEDVNSNEKAYDLPDSLPSNATNPGRIQSGDIMLYGSRTLVVFYESFSTAYSYTRIGQVDDPSDLKNALGSGSATVTLQSN